LSAPRLGCQKKKSGIAEKLLFITIIICYKKSALKQVMMTYFKRLILSNREFILKEVLEVKGLIQLLMKYKNTGKKWTAEEKKKIKMHLKQISKVVPIMAIFLIPGGSMLLPFLADILDRRKVRKLS
jgi:hypothetical protein